MSIQVLMHFANQHFRIKVCVKSMNQIKKWNINVQIFNFVYYMSYVCQKLLSKIIENKLNKYIFTSNNLTYVIEQM